MKDSTWKSALDEAKRVDGESKRLQGDYQAAIKKYQEAKDKGDRLVKNLQNRSRSLEFLTKLDKCLPTDTRAMPSSTNPEKLRDEIMHRDQLLITNVDSQQVDDVSKWFAVMKEKEWYSPIPGQPGIRR